MDIILYNSLSRNGKKESFIQNIVEQLEDKGNKVRTVNILEVQEIQPFLDTLNDDDRVILVGGDGTLNRLANHIYDLNYPQQLFMYQAGTGNDFIRSLKTKQKVVLIKPYLKDLPVVEYMDQKKHFLNGAGAGLDGYIGDLVNNSKYKKNKRNYFRHAFEGFVKFKPIYAKLDIDSKIIEENKVWFASVMHAPYFGGGMKIAPKASRNEKALYVVIVKKIPKWMLILIFPTIYLGWHVIFKRYVSVYRAEHVKIEFKEDTYLQIDGDVVYPIKKFEAHI
ncbi:diacylglycerol/lipid kinase family protein [Mariniplasma anaerobium]|uniref:Transcriptional regulator n=1 Tax=Mariniplasma anaerobium TaxID=2735436 RepID=A0A7U9XUV5_9MOLU|nr:diacylglycerol kinase family protein [Mariniplasma anaerobium]BCR36548.1 transcriptional regulator [Mariniplasma anaerobium]